MKKNNVLSAFLIILMTMIYLFVIPGLVEGTESIPDKTLHKVPEVNAKVKIDGVLNEKIWQEALVLELNFEVEPGENITPPVRTEVLLSSGLNNLYVAFRAYDPDSSEIRARFTDRDKIYEDDYVGIVLDTFNDSRLTYNFYCNPYGIQAEKVIGIFGSEDQWDAIWNSAGKITEEGYIVEMEIPFSTLRFQRKKQDQVWGIDAVRSYPRSLSHLIGLFPRDRSNNCYMCQADKIIGFSDSRPGKNMEFAPTLSAVVTQERESFPYSKYINKNQRIDPGLTARWRFTPNLTLSAAVNPDFSHVEADAALLDVNTPFVLIYPEKRPFFLEDGNLFRSVYSIIYTRRVADPSWGIKLSGKEGKNSIGFFSVRDNRTILVFPRSQSSRSVFVDMENQSTALRYSRDVGKSSAVGFVITDREGDDYYNRVFGIDGRLKLTRKDMVIVQYLNSWTNYPGQVCLDYDQPEGTLKGSALAFLYRHSAQTYGLSFDYQEITPDYRADLGTNTQVDFRFIGGDIRYTFRRNPGHWFTTLNFSLTYKNETDTQQHNLNFNAFRVNVNYDGPLQSFVDFYTNIGRRSYRGNIFDDNYVYLRAGIRPSGNFYAGFRAILGDRIDYANIRAGNRIHLNPIIEYKWGKHLTIGFDHIFERLEVEGGRLYTANLSNLRLVYQFNRRTFLRTILQYADYNYNPGLYNNSIDPLFRHLFSQFLFSYKINPRTVLFLGYSDDYYGYEDIPLTGNNRTFFMKIGYALVL